MPTDHASKPKATRNRLRGGALMLALTGTVLVLAACAADRERGYSNYPDRWEYRKDPSENYGRIYRY